MLVSELINYGSKSLQKKFISSHLLDSEVILAKVLNKDRENMLISHKQIISEDLIVKFKKLIDRRTKSEPIAYIFEEKEFWNKKFKVNSGTLIPRPETELLVEKILDLFQDRRPFILDIGTGTGCILLTLIEEIENSSGIGIDISKKAIEVAKKNAINLKKKNILRFYNRSLDNIYGFKFDLIVSNPPYICRHQIKNLMEDVKRYEPRIALDGGNDGLDVIKKVIYKSKNILKKKGMLALEIGHGQFKKVSQILKLEGFKERFLIKDYRDNVRCILTVLNN